MKQITKEWLTAAEDDLIAARTLAHNNRLTNLVAFHCQQCLEKCFKAMIEELDKASIKSHVPSDSRYMQIFSFPFRK
jgi:HEPN domain-containing protein